MISRRGFLAVSAGGLLTCCGCPTEAAPSQPEGLRKVLRHLPVSSCANDSCRVWEPCKMADLKAGDLFIITMDRADDPLPEKPAPIPRRLLSVQIATRDPWVENGTVTICCDQVAEGSVQAEIAKSGLSIMQCCRSPLWDDAMVIYSLQRDKGFRSNHLVWK